MNVKDIEINLFRLIQTFILCVIHIYTNINPFGVCQSYLRVFHKLSF